MSSATLIEKCCLIANPVAGNPTQYLLEHAFASNGLDWRFMSFEVAREQLPEAIRGLAVLGFRGVKVGRPFQESVIEHLDEISDTARVCGSVNTITTHDGHFRGDNTEGAAFVQLLRPLVEPTGRGAVILGAGRIARVLALALAEAGASMLTIASRDAEAGARLVQLVQRETGADAAHALLADEPVALPPEAAVLVNATSLGTMRPDAPLPLAVDAFGPQLVVADVAYTSARTWLTQRAAERGSPIIDGISLYVEQTARAMESWTGIRPDTLAMREALEEFLGV